MWWSAEMGCYRLRNCVSGTTENVQSKGCMPGHFTGAEHGTTHGTEPDGRELSYCCNYFTDLKN